MRGGKGFTLIELIVTLVIGAILVGLAVPSFLAFVRRNRLAAQTNDLISALNYARSEAVKRNAQIDVCPSSDKASCSGQDWTIGWVAYAGTSPSAGTVLQTWGARASSMTLSGPSSVQYGADGALVANVTSFTLSLPSCTGQEARSISVSPVGRADASPISCP